MNYFYIDSLKNIQKSWQNLIDDLNEKSEIEKYCYETDFYEIFKIFISSLINESDLTVLDGELTKNEIKNLVGESLFEELNHKEKRRFTEIKDKEDLITQIRNSKNGSIVLYTSGTTGKPKAVRHPIENLFRAVIVRDNMQSDVWGYAYHPTHIAGIQVLLQALNNGNSIVRLFGLSSKEVEEAVTKYSVTNISATPTFLRLFITTGLELKTVKRVTSGGEKMDQTLKEKLTKKFPNAKFRNIYATTEFGTLFKSSSEGFQVEEKIRELVRIEDNELLVHKKLLGQFDAALMQNDWYRTGDLVETMSTEPLIIKFVGRKNEMVNVGGMKVNITEVEDVIRELFDVSFVKVYPKQNSVTGNILCCEICLNDKNLRETDIRKELSKHLQEYKIPRIIRIVEEVDRTDLTRTMKINRAQTQG